MRPHTPVMETLPSMHGPAGSRLRQPLEGENPWVSGSNNGLGTQYSPPPTCDENCIIVSNLNPETHPGSIRDVFTKFGDVDRVEINLNDRNMPDGSAVVLFSRPPKRFDFMLSPLKIDGRTVSMEFAARGFVMSHPWREDERKSRRSRFPGKQLSMGVMSAPKTFVEMWSTVNNVAFLVDYDLRQMQIYFMHLKDAYRMDFSFKDLCNEIKLEAEGVTYHFTLNLRHPARTWRQKTITESISDIQSTKTRTFRIWERVTGIPLDAAAADAIRKEERNKRTPVMPMALPNRINLGGWLTLRIRFEPLPYIKSEFFDMLNELAEYNLIPPSESSRRSAALRVIPASDVPEIHSHVDRARKIQSFDVLYYLECAISAHYIEEVNLDDHLYDDLNRIGKIDSAYPCGILSMLMSQRKRVWKPKDYCLSIFEKQLSKVALDLRVPEHCVAVRKVIVSPTTVYLQPPVVEMTNRVIRHFREYADRFIRVQFVDEGIRRISASFGEENNDVIYNRIYKVLQNGIQIGSRRYDFLAFSSSQLRGHGCWFFAPTKDLSASKIRAWMGTFSHVKIIAKNAVRMGQCFSSTVPTTQLKEDEVEYIDDIECNGYAFSDGVGKISPKLAREVAQLLNLESTPSCLQFRLGGAKGVLALSNYLNGRKIQLRPSQIKFESPHTMLEVIRTSSYLPAYLNRQAITILSALGVKDEVFMDMAMAMLRNMDGMLRNPDTAARMICQNMDEFGTARSMAQIIAAGFLERRDPYICNLVNLFRVSKLKDLKEKARIHVPKGAFLLGILDETNTLEENQVFCQISENSNDIGPNATRSRRVVTGNCIIFRNPCFHPGDVRVVTAVDSPKLRHLCDVIVFPAKGFRDIPSMLSGGDLDGDDYTLIWDQTLMPKIRNYPPFTYKAEEPLEVDEVKISHIQKFFVNYINNDNLGQIANAHLATADMSSSGALDGNCLRLAQLHSQAVDFPKTGKPAKFDSSLRVRMFPDFMQKPDKESYKSQKVLGRMFRAIDARDYEGYRDKLVDTTEYDVRLWMPGMEQYILEARAVKARYDRDILGLMNQYGVSTEAELVSGFVMEWGRKNSTRKSTHEMNKQTMNTVTRVRDDYRKEFEKEFLDDRLQGIRRDARPSLEAKAAAWYYVTYHPEERRRVVSTEQRFLSFPWVIYNYLCDIARRNTHRAVEPYMAEPISESVIESFRNKEHQPIIQLQFDVEGRDEDEEIDDDEDDDIDEYGDAYSDEEQIPTIEISITELRKQVEKTNFIEPMNAKQKSPQNEASVPTLIPVSEDDSYLRVDANQTNEQLMKALLE